MMVDLEKSLLKIWSSGSQWVYFSVLVQMSIKVGVSGSQWVLNDGKPYKITFIRFGVVGVSGSILVCWYK